MHPKTYKNPTENLQKAYVLKVSLIHTIISIGILKWEDLPVWSKKIR